MRCLSVRQPWAWAICVGEKTVENRSQKTPYRGLVAIHAGSSKQGVNYAAKYAKGGTFDPKTFEVGAIIGIADLVDVVPLSESLESNDWASGPYCWCFENARMLSEPIPFKGKLNLFSLPADVSATVLARNTRRPTDVNITDHIAALASDRRQLLCWRTEAYAQLGAVADVIRLCDERIRIDKQDGDAYRYRAYSHAFSGNHDACLADCAEALKIDPNDGKAYYVLAMAYENIGDDKASQAHYQKAVELNPEIGEPNEAALEDPD